ncbi:SMI1/KNR4 family protein [Mariniblastus sp.]|nr:SMI1/KNR4 family protein [Mariniblastus sp.]
MNPAVIPLEFMIDRVGQIAQKLEQLIQGNRQPFGTRGHEKKRNPPVPESEIIEFEQQYNVGLPSGYRTFLLEATGGPIGPAYGLFPFHSIVDYGRSNPPADILSIPFPHAQHFDDGCDPNWSEIVRKCDDGEISDDEFDILYTYVDAGTVAICDEGCGHVHRMVVTGPTRGQMWIDSSGSELGYIPLGVSFLDWYEKWIDHCLAGGNGIWWLPKPEDTG